MYLKLFFVFILSICQLIQADEVISLSPQVLDEQQVDQGNLNKPEFLGTIENIPVEVSNLMTGLSWKSDCPVPMSDLRYLTISYWGFDNEVHEGHMIVHAILAQEFIDIFKELFDAKFPIERMELVDAYNADDDASMAANNSSAFCSRANTNKPWIFSLHSYGIAVDINPLQNLFVKGDKVLPEGGRAYLDRTQPHKGIITNDSDNACYKAFKSRGYEWGGDWDPTTRLDYQHFCKIPSTCQTQEEVFEALAEHVTK